MDDKQKTIAKMKKQVEKLDEEADFADVIGSSPERSPSLEKEDAEGRPKKRKKKN